MAFILKPVEKDCVCLVSGKRHIAHERTEMSVLVSGKRHFAHEVSKMVEDECSREREAAYCSRER